jgi:DNA (cytosine-5)-methyltransferase 1
MKKQNKNKKEREFLNEISDSESDTESYSEFLYDWNEVFNDNQSNKYKVLSLFSGIGGMDMGFGGDVIVHKESIKENEFKNSNSNTDIKDFIKLIPNNFEIVFQNDILEGAKKIYELNNPTHKKNYIIDSINDLLQNNYNFPKSDIVIGGFPCTDFSHAGKRLGFKSSKSHNLKDKITDDNNRGTLYKSFVEVVKRVKPKIFVAENVYGLLTMEGEPIKQIINDFEKVGYDTQYELIKANEYGIPQKRWRVIIIGISKDRKIKNLELKWNNLIKNKITCSLGKYFEHLKEPNETKDIAQQLYSKAAKLEKGQGQTEVDLNSFGPTIRAEHHGNIEFRRHKNSINKNESNLPERRLTVREAGLIQTFPPNYIFTIKNEMTSYKYIGNAVPPLLAYLIANKVEELLKKYFF